MIDELITIRYISLTIGDLIPEDLFISLNTSSSETNSIVNEIFNIWQKGQFLDISDDVIYDSSIIFIPLFKDICKHYDELEYIEYLINNESVNLLANLDLIMNLAKIAALIYVTLYNFDPTNNLIMLINKNLDEPLFKENRSQFVNMVGAGNEKSICKSSDDIYGSPK
jgi:hypothetical protein